MNIHNYGKQLLAEFDPPAKPNTLPIPAPLSPTKTQAILDLPLTSLRIDPHQPRQFLPEALRRQLTHASHSASEVLMQLMSSAAQGDLAAIGYVESIRGLASSIQTLELQQPIIVTPAQALGQYHILDGERRYWATLYLALQQVQPGEAAATYLQHATIPAIVNAKIVSADDVTRVQWATNLQREEIPAIDFAEAAAHVHADFIARLDADPRPHLEALRTNYERSSPKEVAYSLTEREVQRLTGRPLARRSLYLYLALAEKLCPQAKALARAHRISVNRLEGIVRLRPDDQVATILKWIQPTYEETNVTTPTQKAPPKSQGRPTGLQRGINLCVTLSQVLDGLSDKHLLRNTPEEHQALLDELTRISKHIDQARQRCQRILNG